MKTMKTTMVAISLCVRWLRLERQFAQSRSTNGKQRIGQNNGYQQRDQNAADPVKQIGADNDGDYANRAAPILL